MSARFRRDRHGGGVSVTFDLVEGRLMTHVLSEMLELLGSDDEVSAAGDDPLVAVVGIGTSTTLPDDPALARLFPDGYTDDPEASADFRRYTEPGLRDGKREAARTALESVGEPGERRSLTEDEALAWLSALNDVRLVLGERLGISEEGREHLEGLAEDDPQVAVYEIYDWLTYLQETLVRALR